MQRNGRALISAPEEFKKDTNFVLEVVKSDGRALQFASEEFKKDKEIVLAAVKSYGAALRFASEELKKDQDVLEATMRKGRVGVGLIRHGKSERFYDSLEVS